MELGSIPILQIGWVEIGLTFSLLILYFFYTWKSAYAYWKRRDVPYLKPKFPFGNLSDMFLLKKNFSDVWMGVYNSVGNLPFCGIYWMKTPILVIKDIGLIKQILIKDFSHFTDHGLISNTEHEPLLNNIFHMKGDAWRKMRLKLAPAFTSGKMKMMFPIMNKCSHELKFSLENMCKGTGTFEAKDLMTRYTLDVIVNCAFGLNATSINNPDCNFYKIGTKIFERSLKRTFTNIVFALSQKIYALLKLHLVDYEACEYFTNLVKDTIEYREKNCITRNDFVDILVRLKNNLSIDDTEMFQPSNSDRRPTKGDTENKESADEVTLNDLLAQALVFFSAGFETSSSTLSFCLYELATRPDIQIKVQKELDEALERHGGFTYQMMQELPYLDNILTETLRRYGAVSAHDRVCVKTYKIPGTDVIIEKGCKVYIPAYAIHHDPKYYPDPFKFDPDRFLEENVKSRPSCTYIPFGEGPRICIGMRFARILMRLALATIFSEFSCKLNPVTPVPLTMACGEIFTTTKDKILIDVIPRDTV